MSGHSKWATIKHKKAQADAKRGKLFSKLVKEIIVAARVGGVDVALNPRLRTAIEKAKSFSMPSKNIENAIKKGSGEKDGVNYEEVTYEGYGLDGVAFLTVCLTDNKNRTVSLVRSTFSKLGGSLGESGSVAWQFEKKGVIYLDSQRNKIDEAQLMDLILEAGADDLITHQEGYVIYAEANKLNEVADFLKQNELVLENSEIEMVAKNNVTITSDKMEKITNLTEALDNLDDVQSVFNNATSQ